jgi:hypothetical protein
VSHGSGMRTAGEARLVRALTARGWERLERSSKNHIRMRWPPTGYVTTIPSSLDDGFVRRMLRRLQREERDA